MTIKPNVPCCIRSLELDAVQTSCPIVFSDDRGEYLRLTSCTAEEYMLCRTEPCSALSETVRTANGEVTRYTGSKRVAVRPSKRMTLRFDMPRACVLTGFGQHENGIFDYSGQTEYLYQANMIISVPFLLSSEGWGIRLDAGCAMRFTSEGTSFSIVLEAAENARLAVLRGQNCAQVLRGLAHLTGRPALLPKWAFGYIQSREHYASSRELLDTADRFRKAGIGLDCIVQDWLSWRDGMWGDKTPDPTRYPSVRALTDTLHAQGVRLMVSIWPNMNAGPDHDEFRRKGLFLPQCDVYNAFSPEARRLYWQQCRGGWMDDGADALWCDNAEPFTDPDWHGDEKMPEEKRFAVLTEEAANHMDAALLLDYGKAHCEGMANHWRHDLPGKRTVILCRNGYAGAGKDGVIVWSGDISATWDVLSRQITEGIKAACSGLAYWTLDIGGFFVCDGRIAAMGCGANGQRNPAWFWRGDYQNGADDPAYRELYTRWMQLGAMLPIFRAHGTDTPREPWHFGKPGEAYYEAITGMIRLRYRLLPYFYSAAASACADGLPMMRALMTTFPHDALTCRQDQSFMIGDFLLAAPVTRPMRGSTAITAVYLPEGYGWHHYFTGECFAGGQVLQFSSPLHEFPLLVRDGAILPFADPALCTDELHPLADGIDIYEGADGSAVLYDDAGDGYGYEQDEYVRVNACWNDAARVLTLEDQSGAMPVRCALAITLHKKDRTRQTIHTVYSGKRVDIRF